MIVFLIVAFSHQANISDQGGASFAQWEIEYANAVPRLENKKGWTALHIASFNGNINIVKLLVNANGINVNQDGPLQLTPIHGAARNGHTEVVQMLLGKQAIPHKPDAEKSTPLHKAAAAGDLGFDAAVALLMKGCPPDKKDIYGATPFHTACFSGAANLVKRYLSNDLLQTIEGGIDAVDDDLQTGLHLACRSGAILMCYKSW